MFTDVRRLPVFKNLRQEHTILLEPFIETFSCDAGKIVIQQGSPADYLYVIISGKVEISFKPYDGIPLTVSHVELGGLFGWSAVVGSEFYTSSVIAIEEVEAVRMHGDELRKLCIEHPEAGKEILNCLANAVSSRWKNAHEQVKSILTQGMKNKQS